jgi:long-chain acyl-CoA synthetase
MKTIPQLFEESVEKYADNTLIWEKTDGEYRPQTYKEVKQRVYNVAAGLIKLGIKQGDRVVLLAEGRSEWLIAELAILYIGAADVPLSVKLNEPSELLFRIKHSESKWIITSDRQIDKIRNLKKEFSDISATIIMGNTVLQNGELLFDDIEKDGVENFDDIEKELEKRWKAIKGNDLANISYTSGTTADPKGIMLTHRNYTANTEQAGTLVDVHEWFSTLLILPWDHSFAHTVGLYTIIANGASLSVVELGKTVMETLRNIPKNIKETKPTFLLSVPALTKNFKKNIEAGIKAKGPKVEKLFNSALKTAYKYNGIGWDKGKGWRIILKPLVVLYDKILFSKIRENFGGRLQYFIGGGALLDIELQRFFYAIGIPVYQGYGLSEAAPVISSNAPDKHKLGSSGFLVKPLELKICDDNGNELPLGEKGEIVVKGENVMKGYWKNEKATAEALKDGWLYTGDMGYMDKDGFLYVLGRFKSLLIGNDGEKYSPEGIEESLVDNSPFIEQSMLYNNQNPYTVGFIVPNKQALITWMKENGLSPESSEAKEKALLKIKEGIDQYFQGGKFQNMFPQRWLPAAVAVLEEGFTEENRMLNSTMKMVRDRVVEHYKDRLDFLYTPEAKNIVNDMNLKAMEKLLG